MKSFFKKYKLGVVALLAVLFLPISAKALIPIQVNQGGTGVNTITGIIKGNGTAPFSPIIIGTGLNLTGSTLSSTITSVPTLNQYDTYVGNASNLPTDNPNVTFNGHTLSIVSSDGSANNFINAGGTMASGSFNLGLGNTSGQALGFITSGTNNVAVGGFAGVTTSDESFNTLLGYDADITTGVNSSIALGADSKATVSNQLMIGQPVGMGSTINTITAPGFPNTRDDTGTFTPDNFTYFDPSGNLFVAPLSAIPTVTPSLTQNQIAFGDGSNLMTSSSNLTYNTTNFELHGGDAAIDFNHNVHFNGIGDSNWTIGGSSSGNGILVSGNAVEVDSDGSAGDGTIFEANGFPQGEISGNDGSWLFNAYPNSRDDSGSSTPVSLFYPDVNGKLQVAPFSAFPFAPAVSGGNFLIGQTSGIISNPAPLTTNETWLGGNIIGTGASTTAATFIGNASGAGASSADNSTFLGFSAGDAAINAGDSIFLGYNAGQNATNANNSLFLGWEAGDGDSINNGSGGHSILIGALTDTGGNTDSIALGTSAQNTASNQLLIGNASAPISDLELITDTGGNSAINLNPATGDYFYGSPVSQDGTVELNTTSHTYGVEVNDGTSNSAVTLNTGSAQMINQDAAETYSSAFVSDPSHSENNYNNISANTVSRFSASPNEANMAWFDLGSGLTSGIDATNSITDGLLLKNNDGTTDFVSKWPTNNGTAGQVLTTDGNNAATLTWTTPSSSCGIIGETSGVICATAPITGTETWVGSGAGSSSASLTNTTLVGSGAGLGASSANNLTAMGIDAGSGATNAFSSVFLGQIAGENATNLADSICIGNGACASGTEANDTFGGINMVFGSGSSTGGHRNSIVFGESATNTLANQILFSGVDGYNDFLVTDSSTNPLFDFSTSSYSFPNANFDINTVDYAFTNMQGAANTVLTNDGSGNLSWGAVSNAPITGDLTGQTTAVSSVATLTSPNDGNEHTYSVGAYLNITAVTLDVVKVQVAYTDENGTSQTEDLFPTGLTSASLAAIGNFPLQTSTIRVNPNTAVTIKSVLTTGTGSIAYDVGGTLQQQN